MYADGIHRIGVLYKHNYVIMWVASYRLLCVLSDSTHVTSYRLSILLSISMHGCCYIIIMLYIETHCYVQTIEYTNLVNDSRNT